MRLIIRSFLFLIGFFTIVTTSQAQLSGELLGAIRHVGIVDGRDYGVAADIGYALSEPVSLHVRAVSYSNQDWRGSAIDETSVLCQARLLYSQNKKVVLSGIGGVDRVWDYDAWGLSIGPRLSFELLHSLPIGKTGPLTLVLETRYRVFAKGLGQEKTKWNDDLSSVFGFNLAL